MKKSIGFLLVNIAFWSFWLTGCATAQPSPDEATIEPSQPLTLQISRYGHAAVADDQRIYVIGGSSGHGFLGSIEAIDPDTGTSEILTTGLIPRRYLTAVLNDGKIYILGGVNRRRIYESAVEIYDTQTGLITRGPDLPTPRRFSRAALLRNQIYVVGGEPQSKFGGREERVGLVEVLDLDSLTWTQGPSLKMPRDTTLVEADGRLYAIGGFADGKGAMRTVESYDPSDMIWQTLSDLPFKMSAHSAVTVDGQIFTFGDYRQLNRVAMLNLDSGEWQLVDVDYYPSRHNAAVVFGDEVFVTGGNVASSQSHLDYVQRFRIQDLKNSARSIPTKVGSRAE